MVADAGAGRRRLTAGRRGGATLRQAIIRLPAAALALAASGLCARAADTTQQIAPEAVSSLSTAHSLAAAPVFDTQGQPIGTVASVTPRGDGMLWSVTIRLEHGRQVNGQPAGGAATQTILAENASFDGQRVIAEASAPRG